MAVQIFEQKSILAGLRFRWALYAGFSLAWLLGGWALLAAAWQPTYALRWLALAGAATSYLLLVFWRGLEHNRRSGEDTLLPTLGLGNLLTLLRGAFIASLLGFLFSPWPQGWAAWLPGLLYCLACAADFFDGYLARVTNHATHLGEILDLSFDGVGVLAAALLAVQYGQAPIWYLSVALVRYLFLVGLWWRRQRGLPVYDLPPSPGRRAIAGAQMCFIAALLLPVFSPPGTYLVAAVFALPFLAGFARDWLSVSGFLRTRSGGGSPQLKALSGGLPVLLRLLAVPLFLGTLAGMDASLPVLLGGLIVLLVLLGAAGRVSAIAGLVLLGLQQAAAGPTLVQELLILVYTGLLFLGTGPLSLWKPEEMLIYRRLGERRSQA